LRIDQLMSFSWKALLPLAFAQVLINGLVLVYDLPDVILAIQGLAGIALLAWVIDRAVSRPRPRPALAGATATSEAAS
jgi:hypothetical protein